MLLSKIERTFFFATAISIKMQWGIFIAGILLLGSRRVAAPKPGACRKPNVSSRLEHNLKILNNWYEDEEDSERMTSAEEARKRMYEIIRQDETDFDSPCNWNRDGSTMSWLCCWRDLMVVDLGIRDMVYDPVSPCCKWKIYLFWIIALGI